ncbi:hypothetical protein Y695_01820 [Hydrogenophaga sp. T4]|nr:hypothetical protein Y695_01820 [Hydrogenophaga sp. T4]
MTAPTRSITQSRDHLLDVLPFAMPWKKGVAVLLVAYFDASARESDMFSVAGVAFEADKAQAASERWTELWGETRCHMTDLHAGRSRPGNPFTGWSNEKASDYLKRSVEIINDHVSYVVATSCRVGDIASLKLEAVPDAERYLDAFKSAYPLCLQLSMSALVGLMDKAEDPSNIAYFIERGDIDQGAAVRFLDSSTSQKASISDPAIKDHYRHDSHVFIRKESSRLFEMVDIVAWEWAKHMDRLIEGKGMRPSLRAILGKGLSGETDFKSPTRRAFHNAGPMFAQYVSDVRHHILA